MQRIRGQPEEGWAAFLLGMSVEHVTIDLDDPRTKVARRRSFLPRDGQLLFRRMSKYVYQNQSFSFGARRQSLDWLAVSLFWWHQSEQRCFGCVADLQARNERRRRHWCALESTPYSQSLGEKATHFVGAQNLGEEAVVGAWCCRASALRSDANAEEIEVFSVHETKVDDRFPAVPQWSGNKLWRNVQRHVADRFLVRRPPYLLLAVGPMVDSMWEDWSRHGYIKNVRDMSAFCPTVGRSATDLVKILITTKRWHSCGNLNFILSVFVALTTSSIYIAVLLRPGTFPFWYRHRACDLRAGVVFFVGHRLKSS